MTETSACCFRWKRWFWQSFPQLQPPLTHSIFVALLMQSESSPQAWFSPSSAEGMGCQGRRVSNHDGESALTPFLSTLAVQHFVL